MKIDVITLAEARLDLFNLLKGQTPSAQPDEAIRMADVYLADIESILISHNGEPPRLLRVRGLDGKVRLWKYTHGVWVVYTLEDRISGMLRTTRLLKITAFEERPPHRLASRSVP